MDNDVLRQAPLFSALDDEELSRRLAEEAKVFVVPCTTFALPGYLRVGLGLPAGDFTRALDRIDRFLGPR